MGSSTFILNPLQHWLTEYLPNAEGKKPNTVQSYKDAWRLFIKYFSQEGVKAEEITYDMLTYGRIMGFLSWLEKDRGCKVATRNSRLAAISKFAKFSVNQDFEAAAVFSKAISKIPYKNSDVDATERAYFTREEIKVFLNCPTPKDSTGIRDHALLQFMHATGMRADEVCSATVSDIRFLPDGKASVLVHGKGGKNRRIKIFEEPATALKKYLRYRRMENQPDAFLFHTQRNDQMGTKCLEEIFAKHLIKARQERPDLFQEASYPPHSMRHTTAMHMLEAGVPLVVIKQFLGHAHLSTTEIYAKLSPTALNTKLTNWSQEFWDSYMDEPYSGEDYPVESDGVPGFLK